MLPVLTVPHPALRRPAEPVGEVDDDIRALADAMRKTMRAAEGVGLAAPQVGRSVRLIVADPGDGKSKTLALANPRLTSRQGEIVWREGCLSMPGVYAPVRRARKVAVAALNMQGEEVSLEAEDHLAVCLQHEIDHLDGVLFVDHLSRLKRKMVTAKYKKLRAKEAAESEAESQ